MPQVFSQGRAERHISVTSRIVTEERARQIIAGHSMSWTTTKKGRTAKKISADEVGFYFSDGKLAGSMWVEHLPIPAGEAKFAPAVGAIPGLGG